MDLVSYWVVGFSGNRHLEKPEAVRAELQRALRDLHELAANLNHDQLQQLSDEVGTERSLLVVCSAFRGRKKGYPNLTVKKIPKAVLARCEWGHDDYNLKVENLPKAPPKPGELFAEAELAAPVEKRKP